jgi:CheY-like chemotaxis protein
MTAQILVVDDEPDVADLFRQQFRRELRSGQFKIDFALSASEALERVAVAEETSLIFIFSDINMPGETGLQLLPKVRALMPNVPVVMITAYGDADTRRKASEGGATDLVTKPIDFGALKQRIDQRLAELGQPL